MRSSYPASVKFFNQVLISSDIAASVKLVYAFFLNIKLL